MYVRVHITLIYIIARRKAKCNRYSHIFVNILSNFFHLYKDFENSINSSSKYRHNAWQIWVLFPPTHLPFKLSALLQSFVVLVISISSAKNSSFRVKGISLN